PDRSPVTRTKRRPDSGRTSSNDRFKPVGCARYDPLPKIESHHFHREFSAAYRDHLDGLSNVASQSVAGFPSAIFSGGTAIFPFGHSGGRHFERKNLSFRNVGASPHRW